MDAPLIAPAPPHGAELAPPAAHDRPALAGLSLCDWPELAAEPGDGRTFDSSATPTDVEANAIVRVVLARAAVESRLAPTCGQLVVADVAADAPVELWVATRRIALGQLRVLDGHYCVQITELFAAPPRKRSS